MGRAPCCDKKADVKKGPWTPTEDLKLVAYIQQHGHGSWRALPAKAGLARCGKSCRLRWTNYLRPDIKRGRFSYEEEQIIFQLHAILGNRWSAIASRLPRRTDNEIKNYWNTTLKKRLIQVGIDPFTQTSSNLELLTSPWNSTPLVPTRLIHMTQWDLTLAEAETRLKPKTGTSVHSTTRSWEPRSWEPAALHPSASFMRSSWKTKVEDTLKPKFGTVGLRPDTVFGVTSSSTVSMAEDSAEARSCIHSGAVVDASSLDQIPPTSVLHGTPDHAHPTFSTDVNSPCFPSATAVQKGLRPDTVFGVLTPSTEDSAEARSGIYSGAIVDDAFPSPTSVGPDDHADPTYTTDVHSPCGSTTSGTSDCFDLIPHQSSSYQKFPVILDQSTPDTFWQRQQAAMLEALTPDSCFMLGDGDASILPLDFDEVELFPQLEALVVCQGAQ